MLHQPRHTIDADEVHVWHFLAECVQDVRVLNSVQGLLSEEEHRRMNSYGHERDRVLFLWSRGMMRTVLASYLGCRPEEVRLTADSHGKPKLESAAHGSSSLRFNLTHSRGAVALAIALGREVGVDVEERQRVTDYLPLAERFFAPAEARYLQSLKPELLPSAFFAIWTLKEAFVKALGRGLSFPLDVFAFELEGTQLRQFRPLADFVSHDWYFEQFGVGDRHCGAVAIESRAGKSIRVALRDWSGEFVP